MVAVVYANSLSFEGEGACGEGACGEGAWVGDGCGCLVYCLLLICIIYCEGNGVHCRILRENTRDTDEGS